MKGLLDALQGRIRRIPAIVGALAATAALVAGQEQPQPPATPQFKAGVDLVTVDVSVVDDLQHEVGRSVVEPGKVEVGRESSGATRPQLADRGSAFQGDAELEQTGLVEVEQEMVLRDVDEGRATPTLPAPIVTREVPFCDHVDVTSMPEESMTSNVFA